MGSKVDKALRKKDDELITLLGELKSVALPMTHACCKRNNVSTRRCPEAEIGGLCVAYLDLIVAMRATNTIERKSNGVSLGFAVWTRDLEMEPAFYNTEPVPALRQIPD